MTNNINQGCQKSILGNADYADKAQIYADYLLKKQGLANLCVLRLQRSLIAFDTLASPFILNN